MPAKILMPKQDDILVEPGGHWPFDAWEVSRFMDDSVFLYRPNYHDSAWGEKNRLIVPLKELVSWRRVRTEWDGEVATKSRGGLRAVVDAVSAPGEGTVVLQMPMFSFGEDYVVWVADREDVERIKRAFLEFRLLPLEFWDPDAAGLRWGAGIPTDRAALMTTTALAQMLIKENDDGTWSVSVGNQTPGHLSGRFETQIAAWEKLREYLAGERAG